jgi:hypothetical protein
LVRELPVEGDNGGATESHVMLKSNLAPTNLHAERERASERER